MSVDLRKNVTDAGYIAVGLGVLGVEQVKHAGERLATRLNEAGDRVRATTGDTRERVATGAQRLNERLVQVVDEGRSRVRRRVA
jgi:hypothetical protein